ncbi:hypothetical protein F2P81_013441 [Scophthalmus maximus]|uniref:Uncharacterized protein n=1 Tax=Scophthalmus maximus TaxID=52904 RepID=A0A6A4SLE9_SCOMX|nr:hypothetical protein F2P81_013441 [Scophthalmus maximus]
MSRLVKEFVEEQPVGTLKAAWIGLTDKKDEKNFVWVNGWYRNHYKVYYPHNIPMNRITTFFSAKPRIRLWKSSSDDV